MVWPTPVDGAWPFLPPVTPSVFASPLPPVDEFSVDSALNALADMAAMQELLQQFELPPEDLDLSTLFNLNDGDAPADVAGVGNDAGSPCNHVGHGFGSYNFSSIVTPPSSASPTDSPDDQPTFNPISTSPPPSSPPLTQAELLVLFGIETTTEAPVACAPVQEIMPPAPRIPEKEEVEEYDPETESDGEVESRASRSPAVPPTTSVSGGKSRPIGEKTYVSGGRSGKVDPSDGKSELSVIRFDDGGNANDDGAKSDGSVHILLDSDADDDADPRLSRVARIARENNRLRRERERAHMPRLRPAPRSHCDIDPAPVPPKHEKSKRKPPKAAKLVLRKRGLNEPVPIPNISPHGYGLKALPTPPISSNYGLKALPTSFNNKRAHETSYALKSLPTTSAKRARTSVVSCASEDEDDQDEYGPESEDGDGGRNMRGASVYASDALMAFSDRLRRERDRAVDGGSDAGTDDTAVVDDALGQRVDVEGDVVMADGGQKSTSVIVVDVDDDALLSARTDATEDTIVITQASLDTITVDGRTRPLTSGERLARDVVGAQVLEEERRRGAEALIALQREKIKAKEYEAEKAGVDAWQAVREAAAAVGVPVVTAPARGPRTRPALVNGSARGPVLGERALGLGLGKGIGGKGIGGKGAGVKVGKNATVESEGGSQQERIREARREDEQRLRRMLAARCMTCVQ
ncbi:hypothetical protein HK101_003739 [Irineochytrium annulatum]|nr:hypothetical protein HK101_003739 [Irineochytrium annulatum]